MSQRITCQWGFFLPISWLGTWCREKDRCIRPWTPRTWTWSLLYHQHSRYDKFHFTNWPFAGSPSRGTKPPCWRANVAPVQDKQETNIILNGTFLCLSGPSVTFSPARRFCTTWMASCSAYWSHSRWRKKKPLLAILRFNLVSRASPLKWEEKALGTTLFEVARETWSFMCRIALSDCCGGSGGGGRILTNFSVKSLNSQNKSVTFAKLTQ